MTSQQHHKNLERSITSEMIVQKYRNQISHFYLYLVVVFDRFWRHNRRRRCVLLLLLLLLKKKKN